ncbi:uncharacterized protein LOC143349864 isoform X3 [Colletes latitarsis]|uniref:uncharacterized protein LOC143349864 isoform X3 n=1 Tax=Colletes latitarsis TaxID=2605962 RepID=UPI0040357460
MKIRCPFDALHMIDKIYFEAHISNCASSSKMRKCQRSYTQQHQLGTVTLETVKYLSAPKMKNWSEVRTNVYYDIVKIHVILSDIKLHTYAMCTPLTRFYRKSDGRKKGYYQETNFIYFKKIWKNSLLSIAI